MTAAPATPFFNYPALFARDEDNLMSVIRDVLRRGAYILQSDVFELEDAIRDYLGVSHVFGVADGTNAIYLGLKAMGIGPGDEVIVPSHTYVATAAAVHFTGATPVLADIDADRRLDPVSVEARITERTRALTTTSCDSRFRPGA